MDQIEEFMDHQIGDDAVLAFEEMVEAFRPLSGDTLEVKDLTKIGLILCRCNAGFVMKSSMYYSKRRMKKTLYYLSEDWCERLAKSMAGAIFLKTLAHGFVLSQMTDTERYGFEEEGPEFITRGYDESRFKELLPCFETANEEISRFQKSLARLFEEWEALTDRQVACDRMDDVNVSSGGKKMWYASMVSSKTRKSILSGKFAEEDAESLRVEGSEHPWQRNFNNMKESLSSGLNLQGADAINVRRLYYLVPLGCTSQDTFEKAVAAEHLKEYQVKPEEAEDLTSSYCSLATRLQNDLLAAYTKTKRRSRRPAIWNLKTKRWQRRKPWYEGHAFEAIIPTRIKEIIKAQDKAVTEPPVDCFSFYAFEAQDRSVLLPSRKRKLEISESLASCPYMFGYSPEELAEEQPENWIGVSQKAEGGKFKKPRLFLIGEAHGKLLNRYHDVNARTAASHVSSVLPGSSPASLESNLKSSMEELHNNPNAVAFSIDIEAWSPSQSRRLWGLVHRAVSGTVGEDLPGGKTTRRAQSMSQTTGSASITRQHSFLPDRWYVPRILGIL